MEKDQRYYILQFCYMYSKPQKSSLHIKVLSPKQEDIIPPFPFNSSVSISSLMQICTCLKYIQRVYDRKHKMQWLDLVI